MLNFLQTTIAYIIFIICAIVIELPIKIIAFFTVFILSIIYLLFYPIAKRIYPLLVKLNSFIIDNFSISRSIATLWL